MTVAGAAHDLHSGLYGGAVPNAARALAELLAGLHDGDGRVAVEGFYDGVQEPSAEEREAVRPGEWDEAAEAAALGLSQWTGEPRLDALGAHDAAADARGQRGQRRLLRARDHDGAAGAGAREALVPARARLRIPLPYAHA